MSGIPEGIGRAGLAAGALAADALAQSRAESLRGQQVVDDSARQMEGLFMTILIKELRKTLPGDGLFGSGPGSEIYEGMFDSALGDALAMGSGSGLRATITGDLGPMGHQGIRETSDHAEVSGNSTPSADVVHEPEQAAPNHGSFGPEHAERTSQ